jgi:predicted nuclease with RNAse H fold
MAAFLCGGVLYGGVDVGAGRVDAALIRRDGRGCSFVSMFRGLPAEVASFVGPARRVAIDAPGGLSAGAHLGDSSVAPKFRSGRCSEIPVAGVPAVPWVTPASVPEAPGWMLTGFAVWAALPALGPGPGGVEVVETFPAACFHRLNGGSWPPRKTAPAGRSARLALLSMKVELPAECSTWGHDQIDAVACALVAAIGRPAAHECPWPDGSVMWVVEAAASERLERDSTVHSLSLSDNE